VRARRLNGGLTSVNGIGDGDVGKRTLLIFVTPLHPDVPGLSWPNGEGSDP